MELLMALVIGVLFAAGTYLLLRPNFIRVVMGLGLYSNAANMLLIASGGYKAIGLSPFVTSEDAQTSVMMDPLPPDIILTAIVISFAVGALFLTLCYRVYLDHGTDNPEELPNDEMDERDSDAAQARAQTQDLEATKATEETASDENEPAARSLPDVVQELAKDDPQAPHEPGGDELRPRGATGLNGATA